MTDYSFYYHISELIVRELTGILSDAEREELRLWYSASDENKRLYQSIHEEQVKTERDKFTSHIDVDLAWGNVSCRLDRMPVIRYNKPEPRLRYLKVAAIFLLIFCIGGGILYQQAEKSRESGNRILAGTGGYKALLVTQNGEEIQLQNSAIHKITFENGMSLLNDGREVTYLGMNSVEPEQGEVYHLLKVPRGGEYQLTLADGTEVWLNSGSQLRYPVVFCSGHRRVYLEGEAYFQVHRDTLHPFIVEAADRLKIEVLGTGFNIQAYPEEGEIYTTLNHGSVKVSDHRQEVILCPDQQAVYDAGSRELQTRTVDAARVSAWKDGKFIFEDAELETILIRLGRWYNLDIFYANPEVKEYHFTGDLEKYKDFTTIFRMLEKATKIHFEIKNNTIIVQSGK